MLPYEISLARTPAFEDALVLAAGADAMFHLPQQHC